MNHILVPYVYLSELLNYRIDNTEMMACNTDSYIPHVGWSHSNYVVHEIIEFAYVKSWKLPYVTTVLSWNIAKKLRWLSELLNNRMNNMESMSFEIGSLVNCIEIIMSS